MTKSLDSLVGQRYQGDAPCWQMVRKALELRGIPAWEPAKELASWSEGQDISTAQASERWTCVDSGDERTGDVVVMWAHGAPSHCGVVSDDAQHVLHHTEGAGVVLSQLRNLRRGRIVESVWRPA